MNKLIFTAILSGFAGLYAMGQNEIRLIDMDLNKSYQTYGGAVKGKSVTNYNPQNEMFRLLGTKRSFSQNETFFFSHPYPPTLPFST